MRATQVIVTWVVILLHIGAVFLSFLQFNLRYIVARMQCVPYEGCVL